MSTMSDVTLTPDFLRLAEYAIKECKRNKHAIGRVIGLYARYTRDAYNREVWVSDEEMREALEAEGLI